LIEQTEVEIGEKPAQKPRKKRSKAQKHGRLRWILMLEQRILSRLDRLEETQDIILNGLEAGGYFHYTAPFIQKVACEDAVDLAILEVVFQAGSPGVLPSVIAKAKSLSQYGVSRFNVSYRIVRMNKRLKKKTGKLLFEKRGHNWALTSFAFEVWGVNEIGGSKT
jgi:hypothetical protein